MSSPKQKFLDAALKLFAERGFYGVSLSDVSAELGLTKQSVLYHFKTKEALYRAVLQGVADRLNAATAPKSDTPLTLAEFLEQLYAEMNDNQQDAQLIARELLDNPSRAATSRIWYFRDFLNRAVEASAQQPGWSERSNAERAAAMYQRIGAINYFAISGPTLTAIWGAERVTEMRASFLRMLLDFDADPPRH